MLRYALRRVPRLVRLMTALAVISGLPMPRAVAQFHTPTPKQSPRSRFTPFTGCDEDKSLTLVGSIASSVVTDRAYVSATAISGWVGNTGLQLSYADVVAADSGTAALPRKQIHDRVATVMRLVQNGGATTVRLFWPLTHLRKWQIHKCGGLYERDARLFLEAGFLGQSSDDPSGSNRGAAGLVAEMVNVWNIAATKNSTDYIAQGWIGGRAGYSQVLGGRAISDVKQTGVPYIQVMAGLGQKSAVVIGFMYTYVPHAFQQYIKPWQVAGNGTAH